MENRLHEVLSGREGNYLFPFFWMRDSGHESLRRRVAEVANSGCRAFCVESRTHADFCGEHWWRDMDILLDEAQKRGMRVWILDDKHFPTGMANGLIATKYPERRKWHLREEHVDVYGPMAGATLILRKPPEEDILLGVCAMKRTGEGEALTREWIDLTGNVRAGRVYFDIPEGVWRVFSFYQTRRGAKPGQENYIHLIDESSVSTLIEAVYEPHYAHYAKYFGGTLAGFFSDEPQLGNDYLNWRGDMPIAYNRRVGMPGLALPWSEALFDGLRAQLDCEAALSLLAGLWYPIEGEGHAQVRYAYMDELTRLWKKAFSCQLGSWCSAHGVEYIGHIIEDMNAHARLGCSAGHFFRALDGQHMAGIDVVLHQILPGLSDCPHTASCSGGVVDPEFFEYVLAKLASSHAHIQPQKQGRVMCEVFGAYGWAEGAPMMKALMDHMLVRGVNHFVPHAFSPDFPDADCPPHFGANGMDPQFSGFKSLMRYVNRVSHLLCGARHIADVAILYHAEAEWCGDSCMLTQKPAKALYDRQIDYDIVPFDALENAQVAHDMLCINGETYGALIVPGCTRLPQVLIDRLARLADANLPVWFVDERPDCAAFGRVVPLHKLAETAGMFANVHISPACPHIRVYRAERDSQRLYMIVNESAVHAYSGEITVPDAGMCLRLDLLMDRVHRLSAPKGIVPLTLAPGQSTLLAFGEALPEAQADAPEKRREPFLPEWEIALAKAGEPDSFQPLCTSRTLFDIVEAEKRADFAGWMRYTARFAGADAMGARALSLGEVGMTARVRLNGVDLGERICQPYCVDLNGAVKDGENELEIIVANSLAGQIRDGFSTYIQIPRSGLLGPVEWVY